MLEKQLSIIKGSGASALERDQNQGHLLSDLRQDLSRVLERQGYATTGHQSLDSFFECKLASQGDNLSPDLVTDINRAAQIIEHIQKELAANNVVPGQPATRVGVTQQEIAQTLRDVATYLKSKNVGPVHNELAERWLQSNELPDLIEDVDQEGLRAIFGERNPQHYWPGKVIPTLIDVRSVLKFCAYREALDAQTSEAQTLIDRIDAFRGCYGTCHLAVTRMNTERDSYISNTQRHPSERYEQPGNPHIDSINIANFTYQSTENRWLPIDRQQVECRLVLGGKRTYSGSDFLALRKATIEDGFRRGGIAAEVSVELGKTYGEDAIVLRMNNDEYAKFVGIKTGQRKMDLADEECSGTISGPRVSLNYLGFEPKKLAFYGFGEALVVDTSALNNDHKNAAAIKAKLNWLQESGAMRQERLLSDGRHSLPIQFEVLSTERVSINGNESYVVGNRYYDGCGLWNKANATVRELYELINDVSLSSDYAVSRNESPQISWIETGGRIYAANAEPCRQVGHHFKRVYGLEHDWFTGRDGMSSPVSLVEGESYHCFFLDGLQEEARAYVREALIRTLERVREDMMGGGDGMIGLIDSSKRAA
jgi:hypothetical protein